MLEAAEDGDDSQIFEEFGDLMFSAVNLSRFFNINAENALTNATEKFINRFEYIEETAAKKRAESGKHDHRTDGRIME